MNQLHSRLFMFIAVCAALCLGEGTTLAASPIQGTTWDSVFAWIQRDWPDVPQMTTAELARRLRNPRTPPLLIDTRTQKEYAVSHLPGALWAETPAQIRAALVNVPMDRTVVLYCSVGVRSSRAAAELQRAGRSNVFNLRGSIFLWANEGRSLELDGKTVGTVHPYNRKWGTLLDPKLHAVLPR
ncbi:MAG: rhodanese-like domain-containing protein [Chthoniobacteraceae bacterium]